MIKRATCPACSESRTRELICLPYQSPPLTTYLIDFYASFPFCQFESLASAEFRVVECGNCQCIFQDPVPDPEFLAQFYEQGLYGAPLENRPSFDPYYAPQAIRELMMVVRFLQSSTRLPKILDFGTGNGNWAILAAATGLETHAYDISDHAFSRMELHEITCHRSSNLPENYFDFINTEQVFEHLPNPAEQLRKLKRGLRPGGVIKIGVPYDSQLRQKLKCPNWVAPKNSPESLNGIAPIEHLNHFEPGSLRAMALATGLEPLFIHGWDLSNAPLLPKISYRKRLGRWLRSKIREEYRPYFSLTQTAFFLNRS